MLTAYSQQPSAMTRSIAVGRLGLPELERESQRHISEQGETERALKPTHSQGYEEFHLSLKRLAR